MKQFHWYAAGCAVFFLLLGSLAADRCFSAPPSITDDGARKIMIANIREHGSIFLDFPGEKLDPSGEFLPGGFHFRKTERGTVSFHAPYFSFLAAHWTPLCCGYTGVGLALTVTLLLTFLLPLRRMRLTAPAGLAVSALTYYGPLCWEMPFAAAWGGLAVLLLLDAREKREFWRFAVAGAVIGAGLFLREEFYVLGAAAALMTRLPKVSNCLPASRESPDRPLPLRSSPSYARTSRSSQGYARTSRVAGSKLRIPSFSRFIRNSALFLLPVASLTLGGEEKTRRKPLLYLAAGGFGAALLYWGCNRFLFGHILGIHGAAYHSNNAGVFSLLKFFSNYWVFLFRFDPMPLLSAVLLLLTGLGATGDFRKLRRSRIVLTMAAVLLWSAAAVRLYRTGTPLDFLYSISLAGANPLFVLFFGSWRALWNAPRRSIRFGARLSVCYILIAPALLSQNDMGIVWGSRHFFVLFPVLACLSVYAARRLFLRTWSRWAGITMVLLASAFWLGAGMFQRGLLMQSAARLEEAVKRTEGPVVTDLFFLPEMTPFQALKRPFLSPRQDGALLRMAARLKAADVRQCTLVLSLSPQYRKVSDRELALFLQQYEALKPEKVRSGRTPMLDCWVIPCRRR